MRSQNIQEKEQLIVSTILDCNNQIKSLGKYNPKKLNLYNFNFRQLLSDINPLFESNQNIDNFLQLNESIQIKNTRNNYYAYFQKVYELIDNYEPSILKTLNESLNVDQIKVENPINLDINTFKFDLKKIIKDIEKRNDLDKLPSEIIKIKTLANKPIYVYGFDICNNIGLRNELEKNFSIKMENLIAICFDKTYKKLFFISENLSNTVIYDIKSDKLDYYNILITNNQLKNINVKSENYLKILQELTDNYNYLELYSNKNYLLEKFTDNIYFDNARNMQNQKNIEQQSVVIR